VVESRRINAFKVRLGHSNRSSLRRFYNGIYLAIEKLYKIVIACKLITNVYSAKTMIQMTIMLCDNWKLRNLKISNAEQKDNLPSQMRKGAGGRARRYWINWSETRVHDLLLSQITNCQSYRPPSIVYDASPIIAYDLSCVAYRSSSISPLLAYCSIYLTHTLYRP